MRLHNLSVPADAQTLTQGQLQSRMAAVSLLGSDVSSANPLALDSGQQRLQATLRGQVGGGAKTAADVATEFGELFASSAAGAGFNEVAFFGPGGATPQDGYYALERRQGGPANPHEGRVQTFQGILTPAGTRASHWRAIRTAPANPTDSPNEFGNDTTATVGVPTVAEKVRWFDAESGAREEVSVASTTAGEFGDVDLVDAQAASSDTPTLIFDVPYAEESPTSVSAYDTLGNASRTSGDGDGYLQWAKTYRTGHSLAGTLVVSNHILRLTFDEATSALSAERWNDMTGQYESVALGTADWELFDVDVSAITPQEVSAQVEFRDTTQSPTAYFSLDMALWRGYQNAQWRVPPNESGGVPSGLQTRLDPIADESVLDPAPAWSIVEKSEVRK